MAIEFVLILENKIKKSENVSKLDFIHCHFNADKNLVTKRERFISKLLWNNFNITCIAILNESATILSKIIHKIPKQN